MNANDLTCEELVELVTDYLEGALPASERVRFENHLTDCDGCTHYVEQMRRTVRLIGTLTEGDIVPDAKEALLHIFRDWKNASSDL